MPRLHTALPRLRTALPRLRSGARALGLLAAGIGLIAPATGLALALRHRLRPGKATGSTMPSSIPSTGVPEIGPLFASVTSRRHTCTASVVDSTAGNMLVTAAHCVVGNGHGMVFVPEFRDGRAPLGRWTITAVHVAPGWAGHRDPAQDIAFLTVAPRRIGGTLTEIQSVTGGYRLGSTPTRGQSITVTGYPAGSANAPITCTTTVYLTAGVPTFNCRGFVGGTSGSPWLTVTAHGTQIDGVIGGRHEGGCAADTSYSAPLGDAADADYRRAAAATPGDVDPGAGDHGSCG